MNRVMPVAKAGLALVVVIFSVLELNTKLSADDDKLTLFGRGSPPFEILQSVIMIITWLLLLAVFSVEARATVLNGQVLD